MYIKRYKDARATFCSTPQHLIQFKTNGKHETCNILPFPPMENPSPGLGQTPSQGDKDPFFHQGSRSRPPGTLSD